MYGQYAFSPSSNAFHRPLVTSISETQYLTYHLFYRFCMTMASDHVLAKRQVPNQHNSGFPFNSPTYNPLSANGSYCQSLLKDIIKLSEASTATYFEVVDGVGRRLVKIKTREASI